MRINEGGDAKAKNGAVASKVLISEFNDKQYESYKEDIVKLVLEIDKAFEDFAGEPLFPSSELVTSFKIFSGSGNTFFKTSKKDYTAIKPKLGDIDVQVDENKKEKVKEFLQSNEGTVFNGFTLLGTQFGGDYYNIFKAPKKYNPAATNIQIDFEFIKYDEKGNPDEFDVYAKNSEWEDLKEGIKGFAKQQLIPAIYKAVYAKPGVVFQNNKDLPSKAYKKDEVSTLTFGPKGSRQKYAPVMDKDGNQVSYEGKPAFREIPMAKSVLNRKLDVAFEQMFGKMPTNTELKQMYSFIGVLQLMKKYLDKKQIQRVYQFYYDDLSKRTEDEGVLEAIFNKFKEVFPFVYEKTESFNFDKYAKMMIIGESLKYMNESNEVAGSDENIRLIAEKLSEMQGVDGKKGTTWISGGAVRDEIIGKPCNDIDLLTNVDAEDAATVFDDAEIMHTNNSRLIKGVINGDEFELGCLKPGMDVYDNLNLRDLTCNAILKNVLTGKYYDPLNGIADIKAKQLRFTDATTEEVTAGRIPLHVTRMFRFVSVLGWDIAPESIEALKAYSKKTGGIIKQKAGAASLMSNWNKLIRGKYKAKAFKYLIDLGFGDWAAKTFPEDFSL